MGDKTGIEWTESTWNPIRAMNEATQKPGWHCEHVSEGCRNCYAEGINRRLGTGLDFKPGLLDNGTVSLFLDQVMVRKPLRWKRGRMIFVNSMTDTFGRFVPRAMLDRLFAVMAMTPRHTYQVLTKRAAAMRDYMNDPKTPGAIARAGVDLWLDGGVDAVKLGDDWPVKSAGPTDTPDDIGLLKWPLPNVWLGTSIEDQDTTDTRIPALLETTAALRFLSYGPALEGVDIKPWLSEDDGCEGCDDGGDGRPRCHNRGLPVDQRCPTRVAVFISKEHEPRLPDGTPAGITVERVTLDWVIAEGESGPGARMVHPDAFRSVRDQCAAVGVPFHFKQWGDWMPCHVRNEDGIEYLTTADGGQEDRLISSRGGSVDMCAGQYMWRVGKKRAGALLDGVEHRAFPDTTNRIGAAAPP